MMDRSSQRQWRMKIKMKSTNMRKNQEKKQVNFRSLQQNVSRATRTEVPATGAFFREAETSAWRPDCMFTISQVILLEPATSRAAGTNERVFVPAGLKDNDTSYTRKAPKKKKKEKSFVFLAIHSSQVYHTSNNYLLFLRSFQGEIHWALPNSHNCKNSISFPNNGSTSSPIQSAC